MSTRYFKHENGQGMVFHDSLGTMHYCPASGFVECDADWQPLKPVVREWVSDVPAWAGNRWRQEGDGPLMYLCDDGQWGDIDLDAKKHVLGLFEVHPGTRTPIDQPLPSSDQFAKDEPSVAYLDGKLNAVAEAVSGIASRVENIEAELHAMSDRMREHEKHAAEQWQVLCVECDRFSAQFAKVAQRLDAIESNARRTDAVVNELSGKMVGIDYGSEPSRTVQSQPIHIQVASLIAVNQKLEADLRIASKERDELRARVDRKPEAAEDSYPRTYRLETPGIGSGWDYFTFESSGSLARRYDPGYNSGRPWLEDAKGEDKMAALGAVRCPDPRGK